MNVAEEKAAFERENSTSNETGVDERFKERTVKQCAKREGETMLDNSIRGTPILVHQSQLLKSYKPTGQPVSESSDNLCMTL